MDKIKLDIQRFAEDENVNIAINMVEEKDDTSKVEQQLDSIEKKIDKLSKTAKDAKDSNDKLFDKVKISAFTAAISRASTKILECVKKSSDFIETLNLLDVAYDGNTQKVREWTKEYSKVLNLDESTLISSAAHFKVLSQSMDLATETGEKFAKLLTQMTLDVSSLYNIDFTKAQTALQYAVEGRGTSLKQRTGVSVLETSVQTTLDTLGIDAYVKDMNDAEKAIARLISMEYQLQASQGDLARTIEAPSNQFRVLKEQAELAARGIGNIFLNAVAAVLPYLNALLIVINTIISTIASLFGFDENLWNNMFGSTDDVSNLADSFNNLGGAVAGVGNSAAAANKKLQGLRGFDKLNVIKTPTETGGGAAGGGAGAGINPKLLDAFGKMVDLYDSKLDKVKTKATQISEEILKWLGFSKDSNGEWKLTDITLGGILTTIGLVLIAADLIFKAIKFINGGTGLLGSKTLIGEIGIAIKKISETGFGTVLLSVIKVVTGIALIILGIWQTVSGIFDIIEKNEALKGVLEIITGIALIVAGVAILMEAWSVALIAGIVAAVGVISQVIYENWDAISEWFLGIADWISTNVIEPIKEKISTIVDFIKTKIINPIVSFFKPIVDAITAVVGTIIKNITEIVTGIFNAIISIVSKVIEIGAKIVEIFIALGKAAYTYIIKPIVDVLVKAATWIYDHVIKPVLDFFGKVAGWIYDHVIKPIWDKIIWIKDQVFSIFKTVGVAIADFVGGMIKSVINGVLSTIEKTINGFIKMLNAAIGIINKIPGVNITTVSKLSIPRLAQGGLPDQGQMFIANERGPELVGQIGGQSFVANQNQMLDIIDKKLQNAGGLQNATFVIQVGSEEVARTVLKDLNSMAKSNGKPITITG